jgi:nicotinate-nucleotide adenylyltransferase
VAPAGGRAAASRLISVRHSAPLSRRVGILGGTFDPVHTGHLDVGEVAVRALGLAQLFLIPARVPPHRPQPIASGFHRFAMVAIAVAGREGWRACDLELRTAATSYTSTTLEAFHAGGYAASELFFVAGADAFAEIDSWHDYPAILDLANFAVVSRPESALDGLRQRLPALADRMVCVSRDSGQAGRDSGFEIRDSGFGIRDSGFGIRDSGRSTTTSIYLIEAATADVSSTDIRQRRAAGASTKGLVPPGVQHHIEQHGLYSQAGNVHGQD